MAGSLGHFWRQASGRSFCPLTWGWAGGCSELPARGRKAAWGHVLSFVPCWGLESKGLTCCLSFQEQGNEKTNNGTHYKLQLLYSNGERPAPVGRPWLPAGGGARPLSFTEGSWPCRHRWQAASRLGESRAVGGPVRARGRVGGLCPQDGSACSRQPAVPAAAWAPATAWGRVWGTRPCCTALTSCPFLCRRPHGAGPVCQAHRLGHQAGEPGKAHSAPLLVGSPYVLPPSSLPLPTPFLGQTSLQVHSLFVRSGWGDAGGGGRQATG